MNLWPFRRRAPEAKYSAAGPNIAAMTVGQPAWTPRDYAALAEEGYRRNAVAFQCVKMIASAGAAAPWLLYGKGGKEVEAHPALDLLSKPAPMTSGAAMFEALFAYYLIAGNGYLEAVGGDGRPPTELWALRPDRMQVIPGRFGLPERFRHTVNGLVKEWDVDPLTGEGQILHVKDFNPTDDFYGMSRFEAAAYGIDRHNAASEHNMALLSNGARPSGALVFEPVGSGENISAAPQSVIDAAASRLRDTHGGPKQAGKPMVFSGMVKWLEMGVTPKDMDFAAGKEDAARDVCGAMGVPHVLVVPGAATFNNVREAKLQLYEETVLPMLDRFIDELNMWLTPRYGDGLRLDIDKDEIPALEMRREMRRTSVVTLLEKGVIDADEARAALQYGPRDAGAVRKVDAAVLRELWSAVDEAGYEPLHRYMVSVGLLAPGTTLDAFVAGIDAHRPSAEDEDDAVTPPPDAAEDDPEEDA